jgi:FKBP-type peptidyl-prolyl cis-trans isomerase FkpA
MSVTTVPIQPIKKGSIAKYWIGIAIVLLAGAALAWWGTGSIRSEYATDVQFLADNGKEEGVTTTKSGLQIRTIKGGEGKPPTDNDVAVITLKGVLRDGTVFQPEDRGPLPVAASVPGFSEALKMMQKGGKYKIWIPSDLGYGPNDVPDPRTGGVAIPGGSLLIFDVELQDYAPREVFEAAMKAQQEAAAKQGGGAPQGMPPGGPGGPPPGM